MRTNRQGSSLDMCKPSAIISEQDTVDTNKGDYNKCAILHLATREGHLDVVQYLYKRGANVNVED